jgi:hypothetical protein
MEHEDQDQDETFENEPIYWFAVLDGAVERGDHATAADAQRELARLGVKVAYGRPRRMLVTT